MKRFERWWPVTFFLLGVGYDAFTLSRIDSVFGIIKQGVYLLAICLLLGFEALSRVGRFTPGPRLAKTWDYHLMAIHFLLGRLLSQYTLFFLKSASLWNRSSRAPAAKNRLLASLGLPFALVTGAFAALYVTRLIPPIPIAIKHMGIYHDLKKEGGRYLVGLLKPEAKFWQRGDEEFLARPGDRLYFFVRIFSPSRFSDQVQM